MQQQICGSEGHFKPGDIFMESFSPIGSYYMVFEDEGETSYLYACNHELEEQPIIDALHIYNIENIMDKDLPSHFRIVWSSDGLKAALIINDHFHAVFNFERMEGYCRTNYPSSDYRCEWSDHCLEWFS